MGRRPHLHDGRRLDQVPEQRGASPFAGGITSLDATGFTLGTDNASTATGTVYHWVAFRRPPARWS